MIYTCCCVRKCRLLCARRAQIRVVASCRGCCCCSDVLFALRYSALSLYTLRFDGRLPGAICTSNSLIKITEMFFKETVL